MKKLTLPIFLILGLSACNEGSREITDSPEKPTITETHYESTVNETLDEAVKPDTQAPNFRFRDSFTEKTTSAAPSAPAVETESVAEMPNDTEASAPKTLTTIPTAETTATEAKAESTPAQKTAKVVNLPENDTLNVRKRAGTNNTVLDKLAPNSSVTVTGESKTTKDGQQWLEIITEKKITGWVNDHYLKFNE